MGPFRFAVVVTAFLCAFSPSSASAQATYATGFEQPEFVPGDVAGQNGWGHTVNSPTGGTIEPVPPGSPAMFGAQSLAVRTRSIAFAGVANHLYSATIDPPAGETGSTRGGVVVPNPQAVFQATLWVHTPLTPLISTRSDFRFAELNPSSKGNAPTDLANRYAQVRLVNTTNTLAGQVAVEMGWYSNSTTTFVVSPVATLDWNEWYRFEYLIHLVDGTNGSAPNDRFTLTVFDAAGNQLGTACGSTWEAAWKTGTFGGGATARAVNGFDFWSTSGPNTTLAFHLDQMSMTTAPAPAPIMVGVSGETNVCSGGTTTLTASAGGGTGAFTSYVWQDASSAVIGTTATLVAGAGTYTVTATDTLCVTGSNTITVTEEDPLAVSISGSTSVCFGGTTTLTASVTGGSGTITAYEWRDGSSAIVGTDSTLNAGAGTYTVTATDATCGTATSTPLEVQTTCKATPVVTWNNPADNVYGTPLSGTQLNATANVPGTFTYSPAAGTILNAGPNQILSTDFVPNDSANYNNVDDTTVLINVQKKPTTIVIIEVSPSPSAPGEPVTVFFNLGGTFGTPAGTITVTDGVDSCIAAATASNCTMAMFTPGPRTITATYSGDANHLGSTSTGVGHRVELSSPTARVDGSTMICDGDAAAIRVRLTGTGPWTLTWSDVTVETTSAATHFRTVTPRTTTTYTLASVRDANGAGEVTGSAVVTVRLVAPPQIIDMPAAELGSAVTLRATPGYTSYQWFRNGEPVQGATSSTLTIDSVTEEDLASYTVSGRQDGCVSAQSVPQTLVRLSLSQDDAVIPVVGTVHGVGGSLFRTTVHLTNSTPNVIEGEITFIDEHIPPYPYTLVPGETRFIEDLLPPSFGGLTSANVRRLRGPLPVVVVHVFNDDGDLGTSGMIERAIPVRDTLETGDRAVLVTPLDPVTTRFNLGIRSLSEGMTVRVTRRSAVGALLETFDRELGPSTLTHEPLPSGSSESLTFEVVSGRGVIYGAATDNGTNDPNMQIATEIGARPENGHLVLPVAGSGPGRFDSFFATALQVHNPGDEPITARLRFLPTNAVHTIVVEPRATLALADVVAAMGTSGFGSLELTSDADVFPIVLARIYSIEEEGQASLMTDLVPIEDVLVEGDEAVVVAPHAPDESRFNIGMRTFEEGVTVRATLRNAVGATVHVVTFDFRDANGFMQDEARKFLNFPFEGDESVTFLVERGGAVIYGVWTDNVTQDPAMQYAARP